MRALLYGAGTLALAIASSPDEVRSALTASASVLIEAAPFVFANVALSRVLGRRSRIAEYLGCGCSGGPSARSLPAAAATWLLFGPVVASARYAAALLVSRVLAARFAKCGAPCGDAADALDEFAGIVPAALLAGGATQLAAFIDPARLPPLASAIAGAVLGFVAAPCGIGAVAIAGSLRDRAPVAAAAFLCIAGIADLRALGRSRRGTARHDALAYLMLAAALGIAAWRHGDSLVHPAFAPALACCACAAAWCVATERRQRCGAARVAPTLMLIGTLLGAPPPRYLATETTMRDLFAGEQLAFTGTLVRDGRGSAVMRYAITCCRADAAPIAVRLERTPAYAAGTWLRVDGTIENRDGRLELEPHRVVRVAAPADPFVYL